MQPENAVPILSWYDDPNDTELYKLMPLLMYLSKVPDVRQILGVTHANHELDLARAEAMAIEICQQ